MFFKNLIFEDFWLIEPVAWPIENEIKILVTICLARSVLDWCWIDRLFFDRSKIGQWVFKKIFLSRFLHTFQIFSKAFSLSLLDRSNLSFFFFFGRFLPKIFKRFLSSSLSKSLLPFFFHSNHLFHVVFLFFCWDFRTEYVLGFLIFGLFSFTFDSWVFVSRCY